MSNKVLIYACGVTIQPKRLQDVVEFAKDHYKFRICNVELNAHLASVKPGDIIVTGKGHSLYVVKAFDKTIENLAAEDQQYVDNLTRNYDLKKSGISSVSSIIKYGDWSKFAKPLVCNSKSEKEMSNSIKGFSTRLKEIFYPAEVNDVRIAMDGNICVETPDGYVAIDNDFKLIAYPSEAVLNIPAYTCAKPFEQLQVGDVICRAKSYAKVKNIKDGKITVVGYTGAGSCVYPVKDFLLGQTTVRVVVSLAGTVNNGINPMLLLAMNDDKQNNLLPLMMMSQQGGALGINPMMMFLLADKDGGSDSMKDLLLMSAFSGQANPFGNLFGQPVANAANVEKKAE